jgi:hypothetical protein
MTGSVDMCLIYGPIISFVVSFLKRIPFVKNNPKWVALFFTLATGAWTATHGSMPGIDWGTILQCVLAQFAATVATHEVIVHPIQKFAGERE